MGGFIHLDAVGKRFGTGEDAVRAVEDLDLAVTPGEFCALVGPSGCGKSTLIGLVAGFTAPTTGRVTVDGTPVAGPGADRVVVAQDLALFDWKTVLANVELGLKAQGVPKRERQRVARHYLDLVDLTEVAERYPCELSGGMRQRLALARALAVEPRCLLLDEPLGALDVPLRQLLQDELLRLWSRLGQTVLLVTHDLDEALYLADRVVVLTPRPAKVGAAVTVPFPRPRRPELRASDAFVALRRELGAMMPPLRLDRSGTQGSLSW